MGIKSVYILNKAGGLMFQRDFSSSLKKLDPNEYLVLSGTLHSVHALSTRISPLENSSGLTLMESETFNLHCFQSLTGVKLILITDKLQSGVDAIINRIYQLYSDYALKNPFYSLEMPIRSDKFDRNLAKYVSSVL